MKSAIFAITATVLSIGTFATTKQWLSQAANATELARVGVPRMGKRQTAFSGA
jgi:hypothetical protein